MGKSTLEKSEHKPGAPLIGKVCGNTRWCLVAVGGLDGVLSNICPSQYLCRCNESKDFDMRSSWITVGPKSNDKCQNKQKGRHRGRQRGEDHVNNGGRDWGYAATS